MFQRITNFINSRGLKITGDNLNHKNFLLEILSEEIPFSIHEEICLFLEREITKIVFIANLQKAINISKNRIVIEIFNVPSNFSIEEKKIKGPRINAEKIQIDSFCKKYFCENADLIKDDNNYFFIQKSTKIEIENFLENFSLDIINHLSSFFKDGVKCQKIEKTWIMPILNICACLNDKIIDFRIGNLNSNNKTYVNINSLMKEIEVTSLNYEEILRKHHILYKKSDRLEMLNSASESVIQFLQQNNKKASIKNKKIFNEIICIVDFPFPLICKIPRKYFEIIDEVLILTLEKNQKYIILNDENQNILEDFIAICEGPRDFIIAENITKGYETVAVNRIKDAIFYQNKDAKLELSNLNEKLEKINFYKEISLKDYIFKYNIDLFKKIIPLDKSINFDIINKLNFICKTDLTTSLLSEFPELQGIIGYHYIKRFWQKDLRIAEEHLEDFCQIIKYQYVSLKNYKDLINKNSLKKELLIFNLILKISAINILWEKEKPTSNGDPFALKKVIDDIFYIMIFLFESKIDFNLKYLINIDIYENFEDYFIQRTLKQLIIDQENFTESDIINIKDLCKKENISCKFLMKLNNTVNLKNNFDQNKDLFSLIKRLKGYEENITEINVNQDKHEIQKNIFDENKNLDFHAIFTVTKWLDQEIIIDKDNKAKTIENLRKIKTYLQNLHEHIIL